MDKKKRVKKPVDYSLAQLQQLVESKQSELADLKAKRDELQKQLNELDQRISQPEGNGRAIVAPVSMKTRATKKKRVAVKKRAKNKRTAKDWAIEILGQEEKRASTQGPREPHGRRRV
jgi:chromosome segregation ATPase